MLSCVPSRSLSEYGIAVKLATGSSAGLYFFQAAVISLMVFCTSSSEPKPPIDTLSPPAESLRGRGLELHGGALQLFDRVAHEAARAQAVLDRVERRLHARGLLLQFADGAHRGVVLHQAAGEVPGRRQHADQECQGEDTHRDPHGAGALHLRRNLFTGLAHSSLLTSMPSITPA